MKWSLDRPATSTGFSLHFLHLEDLFVGLSMSCFLTNAIVGTVALPKMFMTSYLGLGSHSTPSDLDVANEFMHYSLALLLVFLVGIWCIKLSFLFYFRRLMFQRTTRSMVPWWIVMIAVIIGGGFAISIQFSSCVPFSNYFHLERCWLDPDPAAYKRNKDWQIAAVWSSTTLDILTDLMSTFQRVLRLLFY